jgi:hypothetical protein
VGELDELQYVHPSRAQSPVLLPGSGVQEILSYTWKGDDDGVDFQDIKNKEGKDKTGYQKILFCGRQARRDGFEYFWVDTCCIDNANIAELSEAINSMFRWYQEAKKCYVFLADVRRNDIAQSTCKYAFRRSNGSHGAGHCKKCTLV